VSRWDVFRQVWLWPGLPPRGSVVGMSARHFFRITCRDTCWYFCPQDVNAFIEAITPFTKANNVPIDIRNSEAAHLTPETAPSYMRAVVIPVVAFCAVLVVAAGVCLAVFQPRDDTIYALGNPRELAEIAAVLATFAFVILNSVWLYRTMPARGYFRTAVHVAAWTLVCLPLYLIFWTAADRNAADSEMRPGIGSIDYWYWPYHGTSESTVSLAPVTPIYSRLIIHEDAVVNRLGYQQGNFRPYQRPGGLTKLTYTFELEPVVDAKREPGSLLIVDMLNGMAWRYIAKNAPDDGKDTTNGAVLDASVVAKWLRNAPLGPKADDAQIDLHAKALVDIIRDAANDSRGRPTAPSTGKLVSRLHYEVAMHQNSGGRQRAFQTFNAADKMKWEPAVPISYVGVPLMLAVWGAGLWLLLRHRYARATRTETTAADNAASKTEPSASEQNGGARAGYLRLVVFRMTVLFVIYSLASLALNFLPPQDFTRRVDVGSWFVVGGGASLVLIFFILNGVWISRKLAEIKAKAVDAPTRRPWGVPILGLVNVLVAVILLFLTAGDLLFPDEIPANIAASDRMRQLYDIWRIGDAAGTYIASLAWFVAGIGMMLWLPWARRVTVATAVFNLALFVLEIPALVGFVFGPAFAEAPEIAGPDPGAQTALVLFMVIVFSALILLALVYNIGVLVYLTRPRIITAFGPRAPTEGGGRAEA
jgi:hypothetical protein